RPRTRSISRSSPPRTSRRSGSTRRPWTSTGTGCGSSTTTPRSTGPTSTSSASTTRTVGAMRPRPAKGGSAAIRAFHHLPGAPTLAVLVLCPPKQRLDPSPVVGAGEAIAGSDDLQHLLDPVDEELGVLPARDRPAGDSHVDGTRVGPDRPVKDDRRSGATDAQRDPATPPDRQLHVEAPDPQTRGIARGHIARRHLAV